MLSEPSRVLEVAVFVVHNLDGVPPVGPKLRKVGRFVLVSLASD
jgi:hypothetical protein